MLAEARSRIARYTPAEAAAADGILLVDLRSTDERREHGVIPGSVHVPRSCSNGAPTRRRRRTTRSSPGRRLVLVCAQGYSSSLAAATLVELGVDAGDLDGGFEAWAAAGLPVE